MISRLGSAPIPIDEADAVALSIPRLNAMNDPSLDSFQIVGRSFTLPLLQIQLEETA
jgi:hypothetical protein